LVPRIVGRREVALDVVSGGECLADLFLDPATDEGGLSACLAVKMDGEEDVLPPDQPVGNRSWKSTLKPTGGSVPRRARNDVAGRSLDHRHMFSPLGQGGDESHCSGSAADDRDVLASEIEIFRP